MRVLSFALLVASTAACGAAAPAAETPPARSAASPDSFRLTLHVDGVLGLPIVAGSTCDVDVARVTADGHTACHVSVRCGSVVVYGLDPTSGFIQCPGFSSSPPTIEGQDEYPSSQDRDPALFIDTTHGYLLVRDDPAGESGAFSLVGRFSSSVPALDVPPLLGASAPAAANDSNFGTVTLATGFMPDPTIVQGRSGGARDAATLGGGCIGWIDVNKPDHIFVASTAFARLRILAHSAQDVTMVVQRPDGSYACSDDAEGNDPIVVLENAPMGTYRLWLGSVQQGAYCDYDLGFTELETTRAAQLRH